MPTLKSACYKSRCIQEWLCRARTGRLALPTFQRSHVWNNATIAAYITALFENRPTGVFLLLPTARQPQFDSRTIHGAAPGEEADEYLLDGQQRLRSLWDALAGVGRPFYVKVRDTRAKRLDVEEIVFPSRRHGVAAKHRVPRTAYQENLIPIHLLGRDTCSGNGLDIWDWCKSAVRDPLGDEPRPRLSASRSKSMYWTPSVRPTVASSQPASKRASMNGSV